MHFARSGIAVAAGFAVFSGLFALLGPTLGAILTTVAAGLMSGYLTAKLAQRRGLAHGGATAGLVAATLVVQPVLPVPARLLIAAMAVATITAGAWIRANAQPDGTENMNTTDVPRQSGSGHPERHS
jgi:hypothetical protein